MAISQFSSPEDQDNLHVASSGCSNFEYIVRASALPFKVEPMKEEKGSVHDHLTSNTRHGTAGHWILCVVKTCRRRHLLERVSKHLMGRPIAGPFVL